jgi:hypothetical protein
MRSRVGASGAEKYSPSAPMAGASVRPVNFTVRSPYLDSSVNLAPQRSPCPNAHLASRGRHPDSGHGTRHRTG